MAPAGALDDPMLEAGVINVPTNSFSFDREDMSMKMIGLSQRLPFPGKRGLKKEPNVNLEWALLADGVPPEKVYEVLGTPQGLERAFKKLDTIKGSIVWWQAGAQAPQLLADGEPIRSCSTPLSAVTGNGGRRRASADEDDATARGNLGQSFPYHLVQRRIAGDLLVVVEDDREGSLQARIELAEEAPGEDVQPVPKLRRQERGRAPPPGRALTQVIKEGRDISVALIHLIPEGLQPARREVARDQRRLAGARRPPHPGDRPLPGMIQTAEESRPRDGGRQCWAASLGEQHEASAILRRSPEDVPVRDPGDLRERHIADFLTLGLPSPGLYVGPIPWRLSVKSPGASTRTRWDRSSAGSAEPS